RHARQRRRAARRFDPAYRRPNGSAQPPHRRAGRGAAVAARPARRAEDVMSAVAIALNLLLAALLAGALAMGWRLNQRLKALRESHAGFAKAIADLDAAAARAEKGLAELRAGGDEAVELLSDRIKKGRELAARLE